MKNLLSLFPWFGVALVLALPARALAHDGPHGGSGFTFWHGAGLAAIALAGLAFGLWLWRGGPRGQEADDGDDED
ncbi:MAG: hypothetical protein OEM59_18290 [Rhodospirillales bacterium]|nr:hypothetical protein [Rhodospirillales bacterium]